MTRYADDVDFIEAISLIAALEGSPAVQYDELMLAGLGMARAELTEYGHRVPAALLALSPGALGDDLRRLSVLLERMLTESTRLPHTLRIQAAQRFLGSTGAE